MIQEFSVRNFRSFKDETTLSFEATKDTTFEDTQVVTVAPASAVASLCGYLWSKRQWQVEFVVSPRFFTSLLVPQSQDDGRCD